MALALLDTMRPTRRQASSSSSTRISRPDSAAHNPLGSPSVGVSSAVKDVNDADASAGFGRGRVGGGRGGGSGTGRPPPGRSGPRADVFTWSGAMTACIEGGCWERVVGMLEVGVRCQRVVLWALLLLEKVILLYFQVCFPSKSVCSE